MDIRRRVQIGGLKKTSSGGGSTTGGSYTVNLNSQWEATTVVSNPDSTLYDGVYRSSSSYNVNNGVSIMYITIKDCSSFKMYIRSYAESNYDYVMVSQLDQTINGNTSYSDATLVKAHTRGNQQSGTAISSYTFVEFTGITSGEHTITVVYRKDSSVNNGDDRGYVLIEKIQAGSGDSGGDDVIPEPIIDINNYLTIEARENGLTASLSTNACEYCVDGDGNWKTLAAGTATQSINSGHTLSFRGNLTPTSSKGIGTFTINKKCNLKGNCMSMLFKDNAANNYSLNGKNYAFYQLFYNCKNILNVSENFLPATTLATYCYSSMFRGCTNLTTAPELPATTLATYCYYYMFYGCTNLTTAPELSATTLVSDCYYYMFYGCTALTTAPELPATTLADSCYEGMFYGTNVLPDCSNIDFTSVEVVSSCGLTGLFEGTVITDDDLFNILPINNNGKYYLPLTTLPSNCYRNMFSYCKNLTIAPELPATTLGGSCYSRMFYECTSLTTAPELPATTLVSGCYQRMFQGCKALTTAPELPATTLAGSCYNGMFRGCTNLTTAPELPANTLTNNCYREMFYSCYNLNYIKMLATDIKKVTDYCLYNWSNGVASTGTFVKNPAMTTLPTGISGIPSGWTVVNDGEESVNIDNYLTIEALEDGLTASLSVNACEYCIDGDGKWKSLTAGTATESINSGQTLSFRGELIPNSSNGIGTFTINKKCDLTGNCMSMLFGNNAANNYSLSGKEYAFYRLFYNCSNIVNVNSDFLPATTLADHCYYEMFYGCSSLTIAPELPATTLADSCYRNMFRGCTKLNYIKMLATNISATNCLYSWVLGVASSGTFVKNPAMTTLPTATLSNSYYGIPSGWTVINDGEESGGSEITFYIDDAGFITPVKALSGMTWGEFVNSEYANQNSVYTNFRFSDTSSYNGIMAYNEEAMYDMILYKDVFYRYDVRDNEIIEDGETYYAY